MKTKVIYRCSQCGYESPRWMGKCQECEAWNTFEEVIHQPKGSSSTPSNRPRPLAKKLSEVISGNSDRIVTGIQEFNRVLGGGIVKDSLTILTARPGAGKSTLLLQVADDVASQGYKVLYSSAEESESQIKNRADRILKGNKRNIWIHSDTHLNNVLASVEELDPDLVIIDSIQTFSLEEYNSRPGSPVQTMECANELLRTAKSSERPRAVIMVGQMTKEDEMAGLRALEHLVDTVLILNGESGEELRAAWCSKNRFGSTGEIGFFSMTEQGMLSIDNPSEFFMTSRAEGEKVCGSALTVVKEGTRPIIVEVESLVSKSYTPYPSRISECLRREQLNTLVSILEQRGKIDLYDKNVVIKTTGGLQLKEQAVNLAVIISIVSSVKDVPIPGDSVFVADVGLTGELKKVPALEARIRELDRMGFKKAYIPKDTLKKSLRLTQIELIEKGTLREVIEDILKK
ncbi:DNA repair protein RadA [Desulfitobacterium metallireducens]|uniref:DNA repair protein RadA n=1 Tax=Desulfitobacterium metallireducens DSM 15288 TaxID=871968 RepID=W0E534_9FIRM|nr:DNA repair protein RadA [Desulfitobacterium metallireducens]AHF05867.1 DNA repair protein RadA [Desulfitobacterium metallireducens DSM 15288]